MKKSLVLLILCLMIGCAGKKTQDSAEARQQLEDKYKDKLGVATKNDFIQDYGNPEWCRPETSGEETCRFMVKKGERWVGDKLNRKNLPIYDEIIADFDAHGLLKGYKANAQR